MDVLRDPIWQTVGVIVGLIGALTVFVGFVLHNPSAGKEKAKLISGYHLSPSATGNYFSAYSSIAISQSGVNSILRCS